MKNDVKAIISIVSDIHMDIKSKRLKRQIFIFKRALKNSSKINSDAFVAVGDTTSRGEKVNWNLAENCFKKAGKPAQSIILVVGNHDCWSDGEDEYASGINEYFNAVKNITGRSLKKPYFSTVVNGYRFICLGNESDMGCDADISDEQLSWLKNELELSSGKPSFVFCHQSLNERHGLPRTWDPHEDPARPKDEGGVGAKSDEICEILKSFKNVFYFSGHSHMGLCGEDMQKKEGYSSFQEEDGVHLINLPTLTSPNHHGELNSAGVGLEMTIYENKVIIKPKNHILNKYIKSVSIKNGKPYYETDIL